MQGNGFSPGQPNAAELPPETILEGFLAARSRVVAITGAGCSADSGIPHYRDREGRWIHRQPMRHAEFVGSAVARQRYWARSLSGWERFAAAQPNAAHRALARLERLGNVSRVITQNVDGLHRAAGCRNVIELHGRLHEVVCLSCAAVLPRERFQRELRALNPGFPQAGTTAPDGDARLGTADLAAFQVPGCRACGGVLMPNVVFYGGSIPRDRVRQSSESIDRADGVLVVGTSLTVYSAYRLVRQAHRAGIPLLLLNQGLTRADDLFSARLDAPCGSLLSQVVTALERLQRGMGASGDAGSRASESA